MRKQSRIEKLTPEQEARFGEFVEAWTAVGLCTDPADRPAAETSIRDAYRLAGREEPESIVWCESPLGQALTRAIILGSGASVWASVRDSVRDSVWDSVRASVWASVGASVRASVGDSVWDSVGDSVRDSVGDSVWASVGASVRDSVYGQHDASWLAFYAFFHDACGLVEQTKRLDGLWGVARAAGWWLPHERICWVSERHNICSLDAEQRLHAENGPAVGYPDGFAIWASHGVRVPQQVIEAPATLEPAAILGEQNVEIRRVMIERFGVDRLLRETESELVDADVDQYGRPRELRRISLRDDEPVVMVQVANSTAEPDGSFKDYWLRVPPDVETAAAAVAWTFDVPADEYAPVVET